MHKSGEHGTVLGSGIRVNYLCGADMGSVLALFLWREFKESEFIAPFRGSKEKELSSL